jgi:hypothetical protein
LFTTPAGAASPVKYGWWTVTNTGLGFGAPAPQVPANGLYIQNGFTGPTAISALTFQVEPGSAVGAITLKISGTPVVTSPPVACPITAAGRNYKAEQAGAWSDAPAYDCNKAKVTGTVSSDNTTVTFDSGPLLDNGTVAAVILAGGNADQIAFNPPGPDTLAVTPSGGAADTGGGLPAGSPSPAPAGSPAGIPGTGEANFPTGAAVSPVPALPVPAAGPALAPSASVPQASSAVGAPRVTPRLVTPVRHGSGSVVRKDLAEAFGITALLAALVAYSEGFGLLGGRINRQPRQPRQRPASATSEA